jgi:hypothetical protein
MSNEGMKRKRDKETTTSNLSAERLTRPASLPHDRPSGTLGPTVLDDRCQ